MPKEIEAMVRNSFTFLAPLKGVIGINDEHRGNQDEIFEDIHTFETRLYGQCHEHVSRQDDSRQERDDEIREREIAGEMSGTFRLADGVDPDQYL